MTVTVTEGDTQPLLTLTLYKDAAKTTALDLTTATSVTWHIVKGATDVAKVATISDAINGVTTWRFDGDPSITTSTAAAANYQVRAVVHWADGTIETAVNDATLQVRSTA